MRSRSPPGKDTGPTEPPWKLLASTVLLQYGTASAHSHICNMERPLCSDTEWVFFFFFFLLFFFFLVFFFFWCWFVVCVFCSVGVGVEVGYVILSLLSLLSGYHYHCHVLPKWTGCRGNRLNSETVSHRQFFPSFRHSVRYFSHSYTNSAKMSKIYSSLGNPLIY